MRFMTHGTLQNLPQYLANARANRAAGVAASNRAEDQNAKTEEERKQEELIKRMRELGQKFMASGNYTAQGLKDFALANQMSMPEMKGMVDMVMGFKKLDQKDTAKSPGNIWRTTKTGQKERVMDEVGVISELTGAENGSGTEKVPDYMRFGRDTLKSSLGYTAEGGWPDEASSKKFNEVLKDFDLGMKGKPATESINVLYDSITNYDGKTAKESAVKNLPTKGFMASASAATEKAQEALDAGVDVATVTATLKENGWSDKDIVKILKSDAAGSSSDPLGLGGI